MPIEHASVRVVYEPRSVNDLRPWSSIDSVKDAVREFRYERAGFVAAAPVAASTAVAGLQT